jgi:hypothetical protein
VLISTVAFDLIEEAAADSSGHGWIAAGLFAGCLVFFGGDRLIDRIGGGERKDAAGDQGDGSALAIVLGIVLDGIPESMVIALTIVEGGKVGHLGHTTTQITRDIYLSVLPQVAHAAAEAAAALVPRAAKSPDDAAGVHTPCTSADIPDTRNDLQSSRNPGQTVWGGRDSNPRPRDYELDQWGPEG